YNRTDTGNRTNAGCFGSRSFHRTPVASGAAWSTLTRSEGQIRRRSSAPTHLNGANHPDDRLRHRRAISVGRLPARDSCPRKIQGDLRTVPGGTRYVPTHRPAL